MGKYQREKGYRGEYYLAKKLNENGLDCKRISQLEADGVRKGDVTVGGCWTGSVKIGQQVPKFVYKSRDNGEEFLFMKRDRQQWLVCMDLEFFTEHFI